jgi:hypothetical protein
MGSLRNRQENMQETITYYCTAHVDRWEVDCGFSAVAWGTHGSEGKHSYRRLKALLHMESPKIALTAGCGKGCIFAAGSHISQGVEPPYAMLKRQNRLSMCDVVCRCKECQESTG